MAKQTLPTNFKDDILSSSMGGKRKYRIIDNGDGTYSFEDVTEYTQTGSDFGAGQINATNKAVNESCDKADVIDDLEDIVANQANGKIAGAKSVATLNKYLAETTVTASMFAFQDFYNVMFLSCKKIGKILFFSSELYYTGQESTMQPNQFYKLNNVDSVNSAVIPKDFNVLQITAADGSYTHAVNGFAMINKSGQIEFSFPSDPVAPTYLFISGIYETVN